MMEPCEDRCERIARMYEAGETFRSIATDLHCSWRTVRNALLVQGVTPRPPQRRPGIHTPAPRALRYSMPVKERQAQACRRCGLLLSKTPGRVEELCGVCCEEIARGVLYRDGELPGEDLAAIRAALACEVAA